MEQRVEEKRGAHFADAFGYRWIPEVAMNDFQARILLLPCQNRQSDADVDQDAGLDRMVLHCIKRISAVNVPNASEIDERSHVEALASEIDQLFFVGFGFWLRPSN